MNYRKEIDGLRAIAVIPVILFHGNFTWFKGGFIGVDVFFVISGYLISSIILNELDTRSFSIINFYERRARRILPALYFVMLVCLPVSYILLLPHQFKDFGQSVVATTVFSSNFLFWLESGYFEPAAELKPLLHTWSLSIEEQFYLIFPVLLIGLYKFGFKVLLFSMILIILVSFLFGDLVYAGSPDTAFYLLPTRAWELSTGVVCGLILRRHQITNQQLNHYLSIAGLALIICACLFITKDFIFPSLISTIPVLGTALIILHANQSNLIGRFLSNRYLVSIGLISYSAYLIHHPAFAYSRLYLNSEPTLAVKLLIILVTFICAYIVFRLIETPFRQKQRISRKRIFILTLISTVFFLASGYFIHKSNGLVEFKLSQLPEQGKRYIIDSKSELDRKSRLLPELNKKSKMKFTPGPEHKKVLILGDSVAMDLYLAFTLNQNLFSGYEFRRHRLDDVCFKYLNLNKLPWQASADCQRTIATVNRLNLYTQADIVLLTATWQQQTYEDALEAIRFIEEKNPRAKLLFFGSANFNDLTSLSYQIARQQIKKSALGTFFASNKREDWIKQNTNLENLLKQTKAQFISKYGAYCQQVNDATSCQLYDENNKPLMYDTGHVTIEGAKHLGKKAFELKWLQ